MKVRWPQMKLTTDKLYKYSKTNNLPLLGNGSYDFWLPYVANNSIFDRFFRDKFLSWFYWLDFPENSTPADIYNDFVEAIASHLSINAKRYSELYRVQILAADAYDIVNNYDLTETHTNNHSSTTSDIYGERTDTNSTASTEGAREDSTSTTTTDGARSDSGSTTVGSATNTSEKEISGFNSSDYSDADKQTDIFGAHTDTTSVSKGAQTNTNDTTLNKGAQNNSTSASTVKGSETDSHTASGTESINIRRTGNIGVQTAADVIGGHIELWDSFNFYGKIFDEIAKEYLSLD